MMRKVVFWLLVWTVATLFGLVLAKSAYGAAPIVVINTPLFEDYASGMPVDDLTVLSRPFGTAAQPWLTYENGGIPLADYRPDGWPKADFGMWISIADYPSEVTWIKKGKGVVRFTIGATAQTTSADGNSGSATIAGNGGALAIAITGTNPADPFRDFHIIPKGETGDKVWTDKFASLYVYADVIRMMDLTRVNNESAAPPIFANRAKPGELQTRTDKGVSIEYQCALANRAHRDAWFNVPLLADVAYYEQYAQVIKANLDPSLKVWVEVSNEVWNPGFPQWQLAINAARKDTRLSLPDDSGRAYEFLGMKSYDAVQAFRKVLGNDRVVGVVAGQGVNAWLARQSLAQVERFYGAGAAARTFGVVSYANYVESGYVAETTANANAASLLASMRANLTRDERPADDFTTPKGMSRAYIELKRAFGIARVVQYEGGPAISDTVFAPNGARTIINHDAHIAMKASPELGRIIKDSYAQDAAMGIDGVALFSAPVENWVTGNWGMWGLAKDNTQGITPSLEAYMTLKGGSIQPPPPTTQPTPQPTPTTKPTTQPTTLPSGTFKGTIRFELELGK